MKTSQSLIDMLTEKADAELAFEIGKLFNPIKTLALSYGSAGNMDSVNKSKFNGGGYFETKQDVWPYHMLAQAEVAIVEGIRRAYRDKYIANFIAKVDSLQSQIESIQQEIQQ